MPKIIRSKNIRDVVPLPPPKDRLTGHRPHQYPSKQAPKIIVQRAVRPKPLSLNNDELYQQIASIAGVLQANWPIAQEPKFRVEIIKPTPIPPPDFYLGFGGLGDALLLLASCWENTNAYVIFFANTISKVFIEDFFKLFNFKYFLHANIMGQRITGKIFNLVTNLPTFKTSAHLADKLYHGDWVNYEKYIPRIEKNVPWIERFGKLESSDKIITICPSGSDRNPARQRYLSKREYQLLLKKYEDYTVYVVGSRGDFKFYRMPNRPNLHWLTSKEILNHAGNGRPIGLPHMLRIINSSEKVISVDTWLKTYALLAGIPVNIIRTRWKGQYGEYGRDVTDYVFLNKEIWPEIEFFKIEELI